PGSTSATAANNWSSPCTQIRTRTPDPSGITVIPTDRHCPSSTAPAVDVHVSVRGAGSSALARTCSTPPAVAFSSQRGSVPLVVHSPSHTSPEPAGRRNVTYTCQG